MGFNSGFKGLNNLNDPVRNVLNYISLGVSILLTSQYHRHSGSYATFSTVGLFRLK